jgi:GDP-D-mannose dehydratase
VHDDQLLRPNENAWSQGNPDKAERLLGWKAKKHMGDVIKILCAAQSDEKISSKRTAL